MHVYLLCQRCPCSSYRMNLTYCWSHLWTFISDSDLSHSHSLSAVCGQCLEDFDRGGKSSSLCMFFFFYLTGKMTLKSNKNDPTVTLESVNSARTALSDLYLEQLLQNKPKSDKVRWSFLYIYTLLIYLDPSDFAVLICFREADTGTCDRCLFPNKISKNRPVYVFILQQLNVLIS